MVNVLQRRRLFIGQNGVRHPQAMGMAARGLEEVLLRADVALKPHDHLFPDRIDGRVRDLSKQLLEVVVEHAGLVGQHCEGRIVPHGSQGVTQLLYQGLEHEAHGFDRIAEGLHAGQQGLGLKAVGLGIWGELSNINALLIQPVPVGQLGGEMALDLFVGDHAPGFEVNQEHAARLESAFLDHSRRVDDDRAHFRSHDALVVVGDVEAGGAKPIPIEHGANVVAVRKGDGRRTIPGLHEARKVLVHGALVRGHGGVTLPGFRDHHEDRFLERATGHEHELEHVVEGPRIGAVGLNDGEELVDVVAKGFACDYPFPCIHPVDVAPARVDFAVVAHKPVRLSPIPGGEGVRGEAGVHHRQMGGVALVLQVEIEREDLRRGQHAFIDNDLRRQGAYVEQPVVFVALILAYLVGGVLPRQIQSALKGIAAHAVAGAYEEHLDVGHGGSGRLAKVRGIRVRGDGPPPQRRLTAGAEGRF